MPKRMKKAGNDALSAALKLLSRRDRGFNEIILRLKKKGFGAEEAQGAARRLLELDYIDDARLAQSLADSRVRNKLWGPGRIRADLAAKGLCDDVIAQAVAGIDHTVESETARQALLKWIRTRGLKAPLGKKDIEKAYRHLCAKGFDSSVITDTIKRLKEPGGRTP